MILSAALLFSLHLSSETPQTRAADSLPRLGALGVPFAPVPPDLATKLKLKAGEGLVAQKPLPGLTAEAAGVREGDIIVRLNGKSVGPATVAAAVRIAPSGKELRLTAIRDGKQVELRANLQERPRDPGNANYEVTYSHIVNNGQRMRTIITTPKKPGKHPGFFFIQGFSPISYDFPLETATGNVQSLDGPILFDFANSGFVTIRVEKPGVGDSEGGPFAQLNYMDEIGIYREALKQLKAHPAVDAKNVFIFGHSMGGAFGPMVALDDPVRGIAVYGTAARTWMEYLQDTLRYQSLLAGDTYESVDEQVRQGGRIMALVLGEGKTVAQVKKSHPELAPVADSLMPGGLFNGKTPKFWAQLAEINFAKYWAKLDTHVLSVHGAVDFVSYEVDHKLIADIVNKARPGKGKFVSVSESDHLFHKFPTEAEAQRNYSRGTYNPAFSKVMMEWIRGILAGKS